MKDSNRRDLAPAQQVTIPLENVELFNPCADEITEIIPWWWYIQGEHVLCNGSIKLQYQATENKNNLNGKLSASTQGIQCIGSLSGDKYNLNGNAQFKFKDSARDSAEGASLRLKAQLVGQGPGNDAYAYFNCRYRENANGDITAWFSDAELGCKGEGENGCGGN